MKRTACGVARTGVLALTFVLLLTACGGQDDETTTATVTAAAAEVVAETVAASPERIVEEVPPPPKTVTPAGPTATVDVVSNWATVESPNSTAFFRVLRINGVCFVEQYEKPLVLAPGTCDR